MKKTTLIAPFDDPLALALAGEARVLGRSIAALLPGSAVAREGKPGSKKSETAPEAEQTERPIAWNPPSYVSARAAVLEACVRFGAVDEAVIVASPGPAPGLTAKPAEIEKVFHDRVLSVIWLVRELLTTFAGRAEGREPGRLILVLADRGLENREPVSAGAFGALRSFAVSLAETASDAPYDVWTVQDSCPQDDLAAHYIAKLLDAPRDRRGDRVVRFTGRGGIFNRL